MLFHKDTSLTTYSLPTPISALLWYHVFEDLNNEVDTWVLGGTHAHA